MGMVLEHQLTACYAAGSLGGTLGRLNESLKRLSRALSTGSREKPREADDWFIEPSKVANLNQTLRLMADVWQSQCIVGPNSNHIETVLSELMEVTLGQITPKKTRQGQYQALARALDKLRALEEHCM